MISLEEHRAWDCTRSRGWHSPKPKAGFGFEWLSQPSVLRACHPHNWFPQPRICKEEGHILTFTVKLSISSVRLRYPGGNAGRQVLPHWLPQQVPSVCMGARGSSQTPAEVALGDIGHPDLSELQGRCLPEVKWELAVAFDISPKCLYVMTLTRSNYLLSGLWDASFSCSLPHQKGEY